ncbi:MAG: tetratricopeptide repeat protein, partial [Planctomycetes bacterium]|nr:tetratricopeptide repeat protein [Planctomycetota bacterium]
LALGLAGALGYVAYAKNQEAERLLQEQHAKEDAEAKLAEEADMAQLAQAWKLRESDPARALAIAREVAPRQPEAFEVHALLGILLDPKGPEAEAKLAHLDQALQAQPQELELLVERSYTQIGLKQLKEAELSAAALSRLGDAGRVASLKIRGEIALAEDAKQGAAIQFEQALKEDPQDAELFARLLELLIDLRRYDTARQQAATFAEQHPDDARAHAWSARANQRLGRNPIARQQAQKALELDPQSELAQAVLRDLPRVRNDPPPPQRDHPSGDAHQQTHAAIQAGMQALKRNDPAGAQQALQAALREGPLDCVPAILDRAKLAMALGRPDFADRDLSSPAMAKADRAHMLAALELHANAKAMLRQTDAAEALFTRAIQLAPDDHDLLHERGHHYERTGDLARARADLEEALQSAPKDAHYWITLGGILHKLGDDDAARAAFKHALEDSDPGTFRGDRPRAEQALKELGGS